MPLIEREETSFSTICWSRIQYTGVAGGLLSCEIIPVIWLQGLMNFV